MTGILITLILAIAGLLAVNQIVGSLEKLRESKPTYETLLDVLESLTHLIEAATSRLKPPGTESTTPMPEDLMRLVNQWPDQWAREGQERYARELFKVHQDWSKVHQAILQEEKVNE